MLAYLPPPLKRGLLMQCALLLVGSAILLLVSALAARSFLVGGLVYFLPNVYFSLYAFRFQGSACMELTVRSFNKGQSSKLVLASLGFALAFSFIKPLNNIVFFSAFFLMILSQIEIGRRVSSYLHRRCQSKNAEEVAPENTGSSSR